MNIGDKWRDWTIDSLLGEGAFGSVYKVVRKEFGRTYESALKVIRIPQSKSELNSVISEGMEEHSVTEYFRGMADEIVDEISLMSELRGHSNIVSYEDHSVTPITDYYGWEICIRMELLTPLYQYISQHPLTIRDVINLGIDMCKALEVCQKFNLIHRDIKPENIFVSSIGSYKLGDFGIARQMEKASVGMSKKGTYSYMAPEVYKGQHYDSTVDIYSLGIVLYRFLNNNRTPLMPPYPQEIKYSDREKANMRRMNGEQLPPPCNAHGRLAEIILKACAYDPKERYERPGDMRKALEAILYNDNEASLIYPSGDSLGKMEASTGSAMSAAVPEDATVSIFSSAAAGRERSMGAYSHPEPVRVSEPSVQEISRPEPSRPEPPVHEPSVHEPSMPEIELSTGVSDDRFKPEIEATEDLDDVMVPITDSQELEDEETMGDPALMAMNAGIPAAADTAVEEKKPAAAGKKTAVRKPAEKKKTPIIPIIAGVVVVALGIFAFTYFNHTVPDVAGLGADSAKAAIEDAGLSYSEDRQFSDDVPRDTVISQTAEAGSHLKKGSPVEVVVSKGKPIPAPELVGQKLGDAEKAAKKLGLVIEVTGEEFSDTLGKDMIISQEIEKGTDCEEGQVINVVKSKGITQVEVPDVVGKGADEASKALKDLGFGVEVVEVYNSAASGTIVEQSVAGGKTANKGSTVTISKSIGPKPVVSSGGGGGGSKKKKSSSKKKKSSGGGSSSWGDGDW
ncbi:MAG: PASTA domain-containing protein [Mogibacterium sp.]|nr:PASTA domain-containing protein [Mogibacterium sp.]